MLRSKRLSSLLAGTLAGAAVWLAIPVDAAAQSTGQPTAEGVALYDKVAPALIAKSGLPTPESADSPALGCQRYAQIAAGMVRFAIGATLPPGSSLDSPRAETRRQAADTMAEDAQTAIGQLATAGATIEQCAASARAFGAAAFTFAQSINRANVERTVIAIAGEAKPGDETKSAEELAAEQAAQAEVERQALEQEEAQQRAADKVDHAFANLGPVTPAPPRSQAQPLSFNIYLIRTPAMREAKDFRLCFEPNLYQRAAKPIVDLTSAALEVPEAAPVINQTVTDFFAVLTPMLAKRFAFPADRLFVDSGEASSVRGPTALPLRAVRDGCHVYVASKPPPLAHDDATTTFGLLAENIIEDVVTSPALQLRLAALPKLEAVVKPEAARTSETEPARASAAARPDIVRCTGNARCNAGAQLAINACLLIAERRIGKAAIARELEARGPVSAALRKDAYDATATINFDLISRNLELIDGELGRVLERLTQDGRQLRQAASAQLTNQEVDAAIGAGRSEGEQTMGTPVLQCFSRVADGRVVGLAATQ